MRLGCHLGEVYPFLLKCIIYVKEQWQDISVILELETPLLEQKEHFTRNL